MSYEPKIPDGWRRVATREEATRHERGGYAAMFKPNSSWRWEFGTRCGGIRRDHKYIWLARDGEVKSKAPERSAKPKPQICPQEGCENPSTGGDHCSACTDKTIAACQRMLDTGETPRQRSRIEAIKAAWGISGGITPMSTGYSATTASMWRDRQGR